MKPYWSTTAAPTWDGAVISGDGTTGALLWGKPDMHTIALAHERVVLPADPPLEAPILASELETFRALIETGRAQEAAELAVLRSHEQGYPGLQWTDPLVPVASFSITDQPADPDQIADYRRIVDPESGVLDIRWEQAGQPRRIRAFVSRHSGFLVVHACGLDPEVGGITLTPPANAVLSDLGVRGGNTARTRFTTTSVNDTHTLTLHFTAPWTFTPTGARTSALIRSSATGRLLTAVVDPLTEDAPPAEERLTELRAESSSFEVLLDQHLQAVLGLPDMPALRLAAPSSDTSTETLLAATDGQADRELLELQYRASHATITASTGKLPPTLQGVWSGSFDPAWSSDYTMNGNVQNGSIASLLSSGRSDLLRVYLQMLEGFRHDFLQNSTHLFGTEGYVLPSRCSPTHGRTTHFDARHCHEFWTAGGAWAAASFFDDVWHTADLDFLAEHAYPFAREVERFYDSFLPAGQDPIVFTPSYSPENTSPTFRSQACRNATMDRAALWRLTTDLRRAAGLLDIDHDLDGLRADRLARLPEYRVSPAGTLAEWLDPEVQERIGHRTTSQLFGLWFEPEQELLDDPRLLEAVRRLVVDKLAWRASDPAREEMSYGLVQLGLAAAAAGDSGTALECVARMSHLYFLPSLMTTHNVGEGFNADISGGFPAVIHAMLLGSTMTTLTLLPALPDAWPEGSITGLHARGGLRVLELEWTSTRAEATLVAVEGAATMRGTTSHRVEVGAGWEFEGGPRHTDLELADGAPVTVRLRRSRPVDAG